jgi:hypothetical protein
VDVEKLLPFAGMLFTFITGLLLERRMRDANAAKAEAEAKKILAEAEKVLAEADSEEAQTMASIIGAYKTLYDEMKGDNAAIRAEQDKQRQQLDHALAELSWYRRGVDILIQQIRRLGVEPEWRPDLPRNGGK